MIRPLAWFTLTALAASLFVPAAGAADRDEQRFYVTPFASWTFFDTDRLLAGGERLDDDVYLGGRAGVRLMDRLWFDLAGGYTGTKGCETCPESWTHFSGNLMLTRASSHTINPFVSIGGGWSTFKHPIGEAETGGTVEAAAGLRVRLNDDVGIRLEARNVHSLRETNSEAHIDDLIVGAGFTFVFGGKSKVIDSGGDPVPDHRDPVAADAPHADATHMEMELLDTGMIRLSNVNFDYDQSAIRPDAYVALVTVGRVLTKWPGLEIEIHAYTDSRGSDAYNYDLSHRRAESVRAYLLEHFPEFTSTQLTAKNYGESNPLVPNTSMANMQENRRVEFVVLNKEILERRQ